MFDILPLVVGLVSMSLARRVQTRLLNFVRRKFQAEWSGVETKRTPPIFRGIPV